MRPIVFLIALVFWMTGNAAFSHFNLNQNVRVHHLVHSDERLDVYLRLPMSNVVAEFIGPEGPGGQLTPAPCTHNQVENGVLMYYVYLPAVLSDPSGLATLA